MKKRLLLILIVTSFMAAACVAPAQPAPASPTAVPFSVTGSATIDPTPASATETAPVEAGTIPVEALHRATYSGIYEQPITLVDGFYQGERVAGDLARPQVQLVDHATLSGDLDGDGVDDAVVFLVERGGGSGVFTYVAAQLNRAGQPLDAGAVRIEDRIQVKSATAEKGQVTLEIVTQGPGDVACCGTHLAAKTYAVAQGQLVETTAEGGDLIKVSAADLDGTSWTLLELDGDRPALADTGVTLRFQDGQISGDGGCNSYTGSVSLGDPNPFIITIGPLAATQQACPDPVGAQETAYLSALARAGQWAYVFGRLALYYTNEAGEPGRLLFAPQALPDSASSLTAPELMPPPTEDLMMLRAHPWQWISFSDPIEAFKIDNPAGYRINFNPDASLAITADCNDVVGFYQGEWGEALTITVDPAALAECGPASRSAQFVKLLAAGARYFFDGENLTIDLMADGGAMTFAPAGPAQ